MTDYLPLFRPLIEHGDAIHFAYDLAARRVVYVSTAYERIIGDPAAHVNDDLPRWLHRIHPDDRRHLRQQLAQAALNELVQNTELRVARADGGTQWLSVTASRGLGPDEAEYLTGTVRDVTRDREAAINAQKFNTKKDATLEILSHDLAGPLVLLQQLTDHLLLETAQPSETVQELLLLMKRTCTGGVKLIRDFVDGEFLESVNVELKRERADLGAWLGVIVAEYQQSEWHTHLAFELVAPPQPVYVALDINKFQQVINNLLSNAIKFTPDGGRITVRLAPQAERVLVSVADTGVGIPAALQPLLFDKFTKARRPGLRGEHSTGLGMSVIRTIVGLHQGRIWVDSTEGAGTTFYIELSALPA